MLHEPKAQGKPTRIADLRHAQAIGRQRLRAQVTPQHKAACILQFVRKAMAEGQAVDMAVHGTIDEETWIDLIDMADTDELAAINGSARTWQRTCPVAQIRQRLVDREQERFTALKQYR